MTDYDIGSFGVFETWNQLETKKIHSAILLARCSLLWCNKSTDGVTPGSYGKPSAAYFANSRHSVYIPGVLFTLGLQLNRFPCRW